MAVESANIIKYFSFSSQARGPKPPPPVLSPSSIDGGGGKINVRLLVVTAVAEILHTFYLNFF